MSWKYHRKIRRWIVRYTDEKGRDVRVTMAEGSDEAAAKARYVAEAAKVSAIKAGLEVRERNPHKATLGQVATLAMQGRDEREILNITRHILTTPLADELIDKVTTARLAKHIEELKPSSKVRYSHKAELSPRTLNIVRKHLVMIFDYAIEHDLLFGSNPARKLKQRRIPQRPLTTLTVDEVARVMSVSVHPNDAILACGLLGLRRGEIWRLDVGDVDTDRWEIHVRTSKTGRSRIVPVHPALRPAIKRAVDHSTATVLFPGMDGKSRRSEKTHSRHSLNVALRAAGITRHLRPHDLRHTAATLMLQAGGSLAAVKAVLGHSTVRLTVDTYGHLITDDLRAAVERVPIVLPEAAKETAE